MNVPFLDLRANVRAVLAEVRAALDPVLADGQFILGPAVERFEAAFARYLGAAHCVGLNNGTSALHMALLACDVGPGDEVITTPHTWISTAWAISYVGATPVFADVDPDTYTLDPAAAERAITPRTRALLPVHLYGQTADLTALGAVAGRHGLALIEDAAQAHGARHRGRTAGTVGRINCFSFYPGKNLGAFGESGAVTTADAALAARVRRLRDHAQDGRHHHVEIGFNTRMEGVQGAVLDVKLRHLEAWTRQRVAHAARYTELLADVPGLIRPAVGPGNEPVWHLYVVRVPGRDRERFREALAARGVQTGVHYPTLVPFQPAYARLGYRPGAFPVAEQVAADCVSLPMYPELTAEQIAHVAAAVRACLTEGE